MSGPHVPLPDMYLPIEDIQVFYIANTTNISTRVLYATIHNNVICTFYNR